MITAVVGGTVVTPDGPRRADLLIDGGRVAAIGEAGDVRGTRLDAAGCWVLPGGVDPHTHVMGGLREASGAAARGGTTTVLSFTNPAGGEGDAACLARRRDEVAAGRPDTDLGLHASIYQPARVGDDDLVAIRDAGASAIKIFLAYPESGITCSTRDLLRLMSGARRAGLTVAVHCENGAFIEELSAGALAAGRRGPRLFADTRPPEAEEEAVARVLAAATLADATCYLVHLSTGQALDQVRLARRRGSPRVIAEVCLHHLLLDDAVYDGPDAGRYLVAPPLRPPGQVAALWAGLADGTVDTVGSDHCQFRSPVAGPLAAAAAGAEFGLAGIGARLPALLSEGLSRGLPMTRLAQVACEGPARAFGHYPRKGALAPGCDADLVVYDPAGHTTLTDDLLDDGTGASIYTRRRLHGRIRAVLLRGRMVVCEGQPVEAGHGRYLPATPSRPLPWPYQPRLAR